MQNNKGSLYVPTKVVWGARVLISRIVGRTRLNKVEASRSNLVAVTWPQSCLPAEPEFQNVITNTVIINL